MENNNITPDIEGFNIIFEKLEETKKEQDFDFDFELEKISETSKTISLFKESQDSMIESSFSLFTKS